jgi:hypothetical protein
MTEFSAGTDTRKNDTFTFRALNFHIGFTVNGVKSELDHVVREIIGRRSDRDRDLEKQIEAKCGAFEQILRDPRNWEGAVAMAETTLGHGACDTTTGDTEAVDKSKKKTQGGTRLRDELATPIEELLKKNNDLYMAKLDGQIQQIEKSLLALKISNARRLKAVTDGPHTRILDDVRKIQYASSDDVNSISLACRSFGDSGRRTTGGQMSKLSTLPMTTLSIALLTQRVCLMPNTLSQIQRIIALKPCRYVSPFSASCVTHFTSFNCLSGE